MHGGDGGAAAAAHVPVAHHVDTSHVHHDVGAHHSHNGQHHHDHHHHGHHHHQDCPAIIVIDNSRPPPYTRWDERQPLLRSNRCTCDIDAHNRQQCCNGLMRACIFLLICSLMVYFISASNHDFDDTFSPYTTNTNLSTTKSHTSNIIQLKSLKSKYLPSRGRHGKHEKRMMVIGDVHGCKDDLVHLLDKADFKASHDHVIFAGDMVDKGPNSHGVLSLARHIGASCVRGNHEDHVLEEYRAGQLDTVPVQGTGRDMSQYSKSDMAWLAQCPLILSLGQLEGLPFEQVVVVHAGLQPNVSLVEQDPFAVMTMRTIKDKSHEPSPDRDAGTPWFEPWNEAQKALAETEKGTLVVYGHDSKQGLNEREYSIGLDSGCVGGGRLSALVFATKKSGKTTMEVVSVKCKKR